MSSFVNTVGSPSQVFLHLKAVTWLKDSHSLFDYEFNKNITQNSFDITLSNKYVYMFRNNQSSEILIKESQLFEAQTLQGYQFLGGFGLNYLNKKAKVKFHQASQFSKLKKQSQDQLGTEGSAISTETKQEDIYLIVRSMKNQKNQNKGYKLEVGQTVKIGRVEYRISSIKKNPQGPEQELPQANPFFDNFRTTQCNKIHFNAQDEEVICKYCLTNDESDPLNFLMSPCKCSGSSGMVHFKCLQQWIKSKVKKEVVGGTTQYNFQKFFCQLCKLQFPRFIKRQGLTYELMPITKPQKTSYIILEGITEKANNLMVIHNVPTEGIRMGRSHECEIRITDISVSRTHAKIQKNGEQFMIFDSKSKFGTLVKEPEMQIEVDKIKKGIQIGRSVITFELNKK